MEQGREELLIKTLSPSLARLPSPFQGEGMGERVIAELLFNLQRLNQRVELGQIGAEVGGDGGAQGLGGGLQKELRLAGLGGESRWG